MDRSVRPLLTAVAKSMTLAAEEFMRRFLQHVLPSGFRKVRHYGLASARSRVDIELVKWLVTVTLHMVYVLTVCPPKPAAKAAPKCQHCGGALKLHGFIPPAAGGYDTS